MLVMLIGLLTVAVAPAVVSNVTDVGLTLIDCGGPTVSVTGIAIGEFAVPGMTTVTCPV